MERVSLKVECHGLSKDELLKRMSKEQAINLIQKLLRLLEESPGRPRGTRQPGENAESARRVESNMSCEIRLPENWVLDWTFPVRRLTRH